MARKSKVSKKLSKKIDKLEDEAGKLRAKAEKKGRELHAKAADHFDAIPEPAHEKKKRKGKLLLLLAAIGGGLFALKKKRDQELDEALWEEPREL